MSLDGDSVIASRGVFSVSTCKFQPLATVERRVRATSDALKKPAEIEGSIVMIYLTLSTSPKSYCDRVFFMGVTVAATIAQGPSFQQLCLCVASPARFHFANSSVTTVVIQRDGIAKTGILPRSRSTMRMKCSVRELLATTLIVTLSMIPFARAEAQSRSAKPRPESSLPSQGQVDGAAIGIAVGIAAGTAVILYLLLRKPSISGCVASAQNGMTLTAENGTRIYTLAGNTAGVTPGNRMKLQGKKEKSTTSAAPLVWDTEKVSKDYGACHP